ILITRLRGNEDPEPDPDSDPVAVVRVAPTAKAIYANFEEFVVNPAGSDGLRYLITCPVFLVDSDIVLAEFEVRATKCCIQDALVGLFSHLTITQVDEPHEVENIKQNIMDILNPKLKTGKIMDVSFKTFLIQ
ncbi:MAG: flagellar basal body-associated FliL family protein, partial [Planctomycetota bacterium]|nr:flagellar basal body-associated FliL family protein [Planctomycetota bacterium]